MCVRARARVRVCVLACEKMEIIYLPLHCHHQNDSCLEVGNDESHFNVSLIVRDNITRQCPHTTTFLK